VLSIGILAWMLQGCADWLEGAGSDVPVTPMSESFSAGRP